MVNKEYKIGCTASVSKGILNAVKYSKHIGGNATQLFIGNNQSVSLDKKSKITNEECGEMKDWLKINKHSLIIHSPYVLNYCKYDITDGRGVIFRKSLEWDLVKGELMDAIGCVIHMGFKGDKDEDTAINIMVNNIKKIIKDTERTIKKCKIILETSCKNGQICIKLNEFSKLWNKFNSSEKKRLGICIDTAHIFTAGYPIHTKQGIIDYFKEFNDLIGLKNISCFHINDSKEVFNSKKDKHEGIGLGYIYDTSKGGRLISLKEFADYGRKLNIPMTLETHSSGYYNVKKDDGKYYQEIQLFRKWEKGENPRFKLKDTMEIPTLLNSLNSINGGNRKSKSKSNLNFNKYKNNEKIVNTLTELKDYYRLIKDNYRVISYEKALIQLKNYPNEIKSGEQVEYLDNIGKAIVKKINEILTTGTLSYLEDEEVKKVLQKGYKRDKKIINSKKDINELFGIGNVKKEEFKEKGIETINNLIKEDKKGNVKLTKIQQMALKYHNNILTNINKSDAVNLLNKIDKSLKSHTDNDINSLKVELSGSYLSNKEYLGDIDMIIISKLSKDKNSKLLKKIIDNLINDNIIETTFNIGKSKFLGLSKSDIPNKYYRLDIIIIPKESEITGKLYFNSGSTFNKMIRAIAKKKGYKLNEWGLYKLNNGEDKKIQINNEKEIFKLLDMNYIPIENRR